MKHNHEDGQECLACQEGIVALEKKEKESIKKYGWYVHFVSDDPNCPYMINIHTHGLYKTQNHTDLQICAPLNPHTAHNILSIVVEEFIKKKKVFEPGKRYEGIIEPSPTYKGKRYDVLFLEAIENNRLILRLIFPEKDGSFKGKFTSLQMEGCKIPNNLDLTAY